MTTTLVLGGVRSGKSRHAEDLLRDHGDLTYVATGLPAGADDPDWAARVAAHRTRRPPGWHTVETLDLAATIAAVSGPVLVDCLGVWLSRTIDAIGWDEPHLEHAVQAEIDGVVQAWRDVEVDAVAVTNEVGLGVVPPARSGRVFRDHLGRLNAAMSATSDQVHLVVAGRVLDLGSAPIVGQDRADPRS